MATPYAPERHPLSMGVLAAAGHRVSLATNSIGVDPGAISSAPPEAVVAVVDERLRAQTGRGANDLLDGIGPPGPDLGLDLRAVRLNSLLQTSGFHRDRSASHEGSTSDSNHLSFAMEADVFVTNDRKLMARARAVATAIGAAVTIIDSEELTQALHAALPAAPAANGPAE